jgi:BMFP domain-containing protein YqiC
VDVAEWREATVLVRRLPQLRESLARLEARIAAVESRLNADGPVR